MCELVDKIFSDSTVFLTSIIALATFLYMVLTTFIWLSMRKSINLSKQIFESSNRPFIGILNLTVKFTDNGLLNPFVKYSNFGNIPAKQLSIKIAYLLNSQELFSLEIDRPNLFPSHEDMWGDTLQSEFTKTKLTSSDVFYFSFEMQYNGVTKTRYSTKELYKYDNVSDSFSVIESIWN